MFTKKKKKIKLGCFSGLPTQVVNVYFEKKCERIRY